MHKMTFLSGQLSEAEKKLVQDFEEKSKSDAYVGYSPLQCALDDEHDDAVKILLRDASKTDLEFVNTTAQHPNATNENILHVAMKKPALFEACLVAIIKHPGLLANLIAARDIDGDNLLHQFVEFGRIEALRILVDTVKRDIELHNTLKSALNQKNTEGLTPQELAKHFEESITIKRLVVANVLDEARLDFSKKQLPSIVLTLEELQQTLEPSFISVP